MSLYGVCAVLALVSGNAFCFYDPDEVVDLPGMSFKPAYRQWSGYLEAGPGRYLHYWFVMSQNEPLKDPLVLWLNGGPGCSSLDGFLSENGPFHVNDDGATLYDNKFSWNKVANMLYLESPAGVGFSYSDDQQYKTDDDQVADNNYLALKSFFSKFPNFTQNDFYIFGESYGGIYAPTLSLRVATGGTKINLKGFAVGNGITSFALNDQSLIYFGYYHGLFGEQLWTDLNNNCCRNGSCNFYNSTEPGCITTVSQAYNIVYSSGLNVYALYLDCAGGVGSQHPFHFSMQHLFRNYRKMWAMEQFSRVVELPDESQLSLNEVPLCINSTAQMNWLNRGDVRKALHVPDILPAWDICSDVVAHQYQTTYKTMKDVYLKLLSLGLRVLVYNGDTDMACNFLGCQWFVEMLGQKVSVLCSEGHSFLFWVFFFFFFFFLSPLQGAGHMVPQWAPGPAFHMFQAFLSGSPY
uniref:Carboxypeptidase n=1 Tax=Scleropages formosus TaxID=113540 RepID=A0A8C9TR07_SCLFO